MALPESNTKRSHESIDRPDKQQSGEESTIEGVKRIRIESPGNSLVTDMVNRSYQSMNQMLRALHHERVAREAPRSVYAMDEDL